MSKLQVGDIVDIRTIDGVQRGVVVTRHGQYPWVRFLRPTPKLEQHCTKNLSHQNACWGLCDFENNRWHRVRKPTDEDIADATREMLLYGA